MSCTLSIFVLIKRREWDEVIKRVKLRERDAERRVRGNLPIHDALVYGQNEIPLRTVRALLDAYPDGIKAKTSNGFLPLHLALIFMFLGKSLSADIVKLLLERYPEAASIPTKYNELALHLAGGCSAQIVKMIVDTYPQACQAKGRLGNLPLHNFASYAASDRTLMVLINAYPEAMIIKNDQGLTPKDCAKLDTSIHLILRDKDKEKRIEILERVIRLLNRAELSFRSKERKKHCSSFSASTISTAASEIEDEQTNIISRNDTAQKHIVTNMEALNQGGGFNNYLEVTYHQPNHFHPLCTSCSREQLMKAKICTQQHQQRRKRLGHSNVQASSTPEAKRTCTDSSKEPANPYDQLPCAIADRESLFGIVPASNQSLLDRVGVVEKVVFGERQKGRLVTRINALFGVGKEINMSWHDVIADLENIIGVETVADESVVMRIENLERILWEDEFVDEKRKDGLESRVKSLVVVCKVII